MKDKNKIEFIKTICMGLSIFFVPYVLHIKGLTGQESMTGVRFYVGIALVAILILAIYYFISHIIIWIFFDGKDKCDK